MHGGTLGKLCMAEVEAARVRGEAAERARVTHSTPSKPKSASKLLLKGSSSALRTVCGGSGPRSMPGAPSSIAGGLRGVRQITPQDQCDSRPFFSFMRHSEHGR